jgi:hypothetical protein
MNRKPTSTSPPKEFNSHITKQQFIMACKEKNPEAIAYAKTLTNTPWCDDYEKMISGMVFVHLPQITGSLLIIRE